MTRQPVDQLISRVGIARASAEVGVASALFTYRCTIACRHCLFACSPRQPAVRMTRCQALRALAMLHDLGRVVHISGGESMLYWRPLKGIIREAARQELQPHFVQTNASFAVNNKVVRDRFRFLHDHGVRGIYFSADLYHQEHVPAARALRVRERAFEIFGEDNVYGPRTPPEELRELERTAAETATRAAHARRHPPMLVGAAHDQLGRFMDDHPLDQLPHSIWTLHGDDQGAGCPGQFDLARIWEVHIDAYDNIQTNCGVILGSVNRTTPLQALDRARPHHDALVNVLIDDGPLGLAAFAARRHGYCPPATAKSKCALCFGVRRFLRHHYPATFGPPEIYQPGE